MATIWFLSLIFLICILLVAFRQKNLQKTQLPPSPRGFPIIGNLHQLGESPHQSLSRLSKKYGSVMFLKYGSIPTVVVSSSETAKQVLKIHDIHCCSRPNSAGTITLTQIHTNVSICIGLFIGLNKTHNYLGRRALSYNYLDLAFSPVTDYWKGLRKMCIQELFNAKRVHSMQPIKEEEVKKLIVLIEESASQNTPINLSEKFHALTLSVMSKAAFGLTLDGTVFNKNEFDKLIREASLFLGSFSASDFFPNYGWVIDWLTGLQGRGKRTVRDLDAFYEKLLDLHKQENKQGVEDFVDHLLRLEKEETVLGSRKLTRNHIKAVLMNVLLGAMNTSARTMTWAMTELVRNERAMKKVQSEIRNQMKNKSVITLEDINHLHYLNMVVKETLRLHPPVPLLIPREVTSEVEINGYKIKPNTMLQVNVWAIGRDPDSWKDAEMFFPERFLDNNIDEKGQNFELLPFGSGRRICPGMYMGTTMVEFGLANMLYQFDWKLPQGMVVKDIDMGESSGLSVGKKNDLLLVPIKVFNH